MNSETNEEILSIQACLLKDGAEILDKRVNEIEKIAREKNHSTIENAEMESAIDVFQIRSLKLYRDILFYISEEVKRNDYIHFFLFPHVRTFLDVYGKFIYLLERDSKEKQALVCITYQLRLSKRLSDLEYLKTLSIYKNFLKNFNFPTNSSAYSKKWIKENGLNFAQMESLLASEKVKKYSIEVYNIFGTDKNYLFYSHFSEFLHGNPYYYDAHKNEKFWVIAISISTTAFFIELIDLYILKKRNSSDFIHWLNKIKKHKPEFIELWKKQNV
jgi:hypothetical protein